MYVPKADLQTNINPTESNVDMRLPLKELANRSKIRPEGYMDELLKSGNVVNDILDISIDEYLKITKKYSPTPTSIYNGQKNIKTNIDIILPTINNNGGSFIGSQDTTKMPPLNKQLSNAIGAVGRIAGAIVHGQKIRASKEVIDKRYKTCDSCEFKKNNRCSLCGCNWHAKISLTTEKCPKNFW